MKITSYAFLLISILLVFNSAIFSSGRERIILFESDITVNDDGTMLVEETIKVESQGIDIKRGIYRDFPTSYKDSHGNFYNVSFDLLEVIRDGQSEDFHTENLSNGIRVYCGKKDYFLSPGIYTYRIVYKTSRQLGFFEKFDELYWNVTGNGWDFMIETAAATVHLPTGISRNEITTYGYTGQQGDIGTEYNSQIVSGSEVKFNSTKVLYPREGLTIVVQFPKGFVKEPSDIEKLGYFMDDNKSIIIGIVGIIFLIIYYIIVWVKVGRDPAKGVIIPLFESPDNLSPGAVRFINEMGFDNKTFTAGIVSLAVKGCLKIIEKDGDYTIDKIKSDYEGISKNEKILLNVLPDKLELKQTNHSKISNAIKKYKDSLKNSYEKIYFYTNRKYFFIGLLITAIILMLVGITSSEDALFGIFWLSFWSLGVGFLLFTVFRSWKGAIVNGRIKAASFAGAVFITIFSIPFVIGEIVGFVLFADAASPIMIVILAIMVTTNIIFYQLLKAPTLLGRKVMDKIEGLKMYMSIAEKDRLNLMKSPERTPEVFEKFLPYALALDVENKWADQFSDILNKSKEDYSPAWYNGAAWSTFGASGFASSLSGSFSSTISSSSTAPGSSSSGGGGGSSGGGGGGGGGGGW